MPRANGGSGKRLPLRIIPERGKVTQDLVEAADAQGRDVFDDNIFRPERADDAAELSPEARSSARQTGAPAEIADVLAREAAADEIDLQRGVRLSREGADIVEARDALPVASEDRSAVGVAFDLPVAAEARAVEAEVESADAGEERAESEAARGPSLSVVKLTVVSALLRQRPHRSIHNTARGCPARCAAAGTRVPVRGGSGPTPGGW